MDHISDIPYPERLVVEVMFYACFNSDKTVDMTGAEIKALLMKIFPDELVEQAACRLTQPPQQEGE